MDLQYWNNGMWYYDVEEYINIFFMNILNYEVEYMYDIVLVQDLLNCLLLMDIYDVQEYLGWFLLNDVKGIILNGIEDVVGNFI